MSVVLYADSPASLSRLRITHIIVIVHNTQYSVHSTQAPESLHASAKPCYRQHAHDTILYSLVHYTRCRRTVHAVFDGSGGGGGDIEPPPRTLVDVVVAVVSSVSDHLPMTIQRSSNNI